MAKVKIKAQMTFERYEKKFLVPREKFFCFRKDFEKFMTIDHYGKHTISNIYYDTSDYSVIRESLDKPVFKEKLRLRSYKTPKKEDFVFLELKKKFSKVTYKRRISLPLYEAENYLEDSTFPESYSGLPNNFAEIDWYIKNHELSPAIYLAYDRFAYFKGDEPSLRLTVDSNIRWRTQGLNLSLGDYGCEVLDVENYLIEIKTSASFPIWLSQLLSKHKIYSRSFSKYGTIYQNHLIKVKEITIKKEADLAC